jgi:hypothetical protein
LLVPPLVTTVTVKLPALVPKFGTVAVIEVAEFTVYDAAVLPNSTAVTLVKPVPVMVTEDPVVSAVGVILVSTDGVPPVVVVPVPVADPV